MSIRTLRRLAVVLTVLNSLAGVCPVAHAGWTIIQLTDNSTDDGYPAISGANIVWQHWDGSHWQIHSNFAGPLTNSATDDQLSPDISGTNVVWYNWHTPEYIHCNFVEGGTLPGSIYAFCPRISGENVVWVAPYYYNLPLYDNRWNIFSNFAGQLSFSVSQDIWGPAVSGNIVVWAEGNFIKSNLLPPISSFFPRSPDIDGTNVVWAAIDTVGQISDFEIFSTFAGKLTDDFIPDSGPRVSGTNVVWQHGTGDAAEIVTNFGGQVTNNGVADWYPDISGNTVVWQGWDGSDWEIYAATYSLNSPPVAVGREAVVAVGEVPNIDGGSYDPDEGDTITLSQSPEGAFSEAGVYCVELTVTDSHGAVDTCPVMVVVYDPSAGFVTGGGWIDSPPGAYQLDTTLAGRASFGFVSKYQKGAKIPTGQTEFVFQAADMSFHSASYDWLVVTGSNYARFKGAGTIDGFGPYKFLLWAGDDEPDTFGIRIWMEDNGLEMVVYDNGMDQPLGGGSVVIHAK